MKKGKQKQKTKTKKTKQKTLGERVNETTLYSVITIISIFFDPH